MVEILSRITIINQYLLPFEQRPNSRHLQIAKFFELKGHEVTLVCASHHHLKKSYHVSLSKSSASCKTLQIKTGAYSSNGRIGRILSWLVFAFKLCFLKFGSAPPNVVIVSSPSLVSCLAAELLAKRVGAKFVFEFRDIWPDTIIEIGKISRFNPGIWLLGKIEKRAIMRSDYIIHSMEGGKNYVETKFGCGFKCIWIPNGECDTKPIKPKSTVKSLSPFIFRSKDNFIVSYLGSFGLANSIDTIIKSAIILRSHKTIKFVLVGSGPLKEKIVDQIHQNNLENVHVLPYATSDQARLILESSSAAIICWKNLGIYSYGTSAAKFSTYLKAGKPIIQAYSGSYDHVKEFNLGGSAPAENAEALADQILKLSAMSFEELQGYGSRSRSLYESTFRYSEILKRLERIFES
ncbi:glycosyltransferase family 4 protein [Alphaproteobacteria bacterium]|nr:glycosyltransferase family 4 protein [Alphaproteobacteria bacterium]